MELYLPPRHKVVKTNKDDPSAFYYNPFTSYLYRMRLSIVATLLQYSLFNRILEVGSGSGVFLPFLKKHGALVVASDIHDKLDSVKKAINSDKNNATFCAADVRNLSFADSSFHCVICISVLEFVAPVEAAVREIRRVLKSGGVVIVGTPVFQWMLQLWYLITGYTVYQIRHKNSHAEIIKALLRSFSLEKTVLFPSWMPLDKAFFVTLMMRSNSASDFHPEKWTR